MKARTEVAHVTTADIVPFMLAPKGGLPISVQDHSSVIETEDGSSNPERKKDVSDERLEKLFSKVDLSGIEDWGEEDQQEIRSLIAVHAHLFALDDLDLCKMSVVKHHIELTDYTPFKETYYCIPSSQFEEVKKHLQEMLALGAIKRPNSPWASGVVLVRKKDSCLRFCIDLKNLDSCILKDTYSLPRIDEALDCLNGTKIFTSLNLKSGFWQVKLYEESKPLTAFTVGPVWFYECEQMPFGLTNAPATFQHLMETCLGDLHLNWCIVYLDDVIIFSKMPKEHILRLQAVFPKLATAGLKLKPSKCEFFKNKITYLGHVVSSNGIQTDPKRTAAFENWPKPVTVTDVCSFLGFTNYYRNCIPRNAQVAWPLNVLTSRENSMKKKKLVDWIPECEVAFDTLKKLCSSAQILAYADYTKLCRLHTNVSTSGLGAVLYQG